MVTYCVGESFLESFLAVSKTTFSIRLRAFLSQYIFALSNPFSPSGYLFIDAVPFISGLFMFNPIFHGSLNPEHFYDELFSFAFISHLLHC